MAKYFFLALLFISSTFWYYYYDRPIDSCGTINLLNYNENKNYIIKTNLGTSF